eukprot:TRINITY_DN36629_c0_g1_i1.p1 TRINITY_DN36629_c0_g1~~TRINITY_DN36629_c0_g1_i1.p1  ORF type:complete len:553 (+),score=72.39 TRINITY_DN36629_c0_g1_i1:55-1713(+)
MPNACQKVFDVDMDDLFAYKTERRVIMRDRKLGIARVLIIIILFIYVVIYEVIINKGYLIKDEPVGFSTISVRRGLEWNAQEDHCCPSGGCGECTGTVPTCVQWTTQDSCTRSGCNWNYAPSRTSGNNIQFECVGWDRHNILRPAAEEYSALITTRIKVTDYNEIPKQCDLNATSMQCPSWEATSVKSYYTSGIEEMTIMIDHGVYGRESKRIVMGQDMNKGVMKLPEGELHFCGSPILGMANDADVDCTEDDRKRPGDIFTVRQLLKSAGVGTLEEIYDDESLRYHGVVILVIISYDGEGIDTELTYTYRSFALRGVEFKNEQSVITDLPSGNITRSVWKRHGIRVVLVPAGYVAIFSFVELMKTLMVAGGLFSIAKLLVEHILIRFLPYSTVYKRYRDIKTVDFSDHDKEGLLQLDDVHYVYGEVRQGGTINPSDEDEKEMGDKIDEKVTNFKTQYPPPPFIPNGGGGILKHTNPEVTSDPSSKTPPETHPEPATAGVYYTSVNASPNNHPGTELSQYLLNGEPPQPARFPSPNFGNTKLWVDRYKTGSI